MSNETHIELTEAWIYEHLSDVTEKAAAWVLLQEPGFIGFGVVQHDEIMLPPNKPQDSPDWALTSDLRLFGEKGEWHVWRDWDGKHHARLLESQNVKDALTEYHALWGSKVNSGTPPWIRLVEDRGVEIWLPLAEFGLKECDLPLRLKLKQVIGYDCHSHLAGIIDAALIGLVCNSNDNLLLPTDLPSCP